MHKSNKILHHKDSWELSNNNQLYLIKDQTDNWIKLFTKMNIPCGPIYNIKQAVENPQITFRNMIVSSNHKKIGKFKMAGNPIKMSNYKDPKTRDRRRWSTTTEAGTNRRQSPGNHFVTAQSITKNNQQQPATRTKLP